MKNNIILALIFIAAYVLLGLGIGSIIYTPNALGMCMTDDGLKIYFDTVFHTKWGSGMFFKGMNYPYTEPLQLAGSQAAINFLLQQLQAIGINVSPYVIGIINFTNHVLVPVGVIIAFKLLRRLQLNYFIAICGAFILIFCSPFIDRINGHYNLMYPFFMPLILLWVLIIVQQKSSNFYLACLFVLLFVFGFNNAYFLAIGGLFVMLIALFLFIQKNNKAIPIFLVALSSVMANVVLVKYLDDIQGRVAIPWGFQMNGSNFSGLFIPQYGKPYVWFKNIFDSALASSGESVCYLGLLSIPLIVTGFVFYFKNKRQFVWQTTNIVFSKSIVLAALIMLVIAGGMLINPAFSYWETRLPMLMQFRASGRLAWPLFFVYTIMALQLVQYLYYAIPNKILIIFFAIIIIMGFGIDIANKYEQHLLSCKWFRGDNIFATTAINQLPAINTDSISCILTMPAMEQWTDKITAEGNSDCKKISMQYSYKYGLPMISALLSRMSYWHTLQALQLSSSAFIYKDLYK
jgi:hypothetical protein